MAKKPGLLDAFKGLTQKKGVKDKEIEKYEKILEEHADDRNALNALGDLYAKRNDAEKACEYYLRVGELYAKDGFTLKSIAVYKKAQRARPDLTKTYSDLADLYVQKGLIGEAKSNYLTAAEMQAASGAKHESLDTYRKIADLDPHNLNIRLKLAAMYEKEDFIEDAAIIYAEIGDVVIRQDTAQGKQHYRRALELQPQNQDILSRIGYAYVDHVMPKEAVDIFTRLRELDPKNLDYQEQLEELRAASTAGRKTPSVAAAAAAPISFSEEELTSLDLTEEAADDLRNMTGLEMEPAPAAEHVIEFPLMDLSAESAPAEQTPENQTLDFQIGDQGAIAWETSDMPPAAAEASAFQAEPRLDFSLAGTEVRFQDDAARHERAPAKEQITLQTEAAGTSQFFDLAARLDTAAQLGRSYEQKNAPPKKAPFGSAQGTRPKVKIQAPESLATSDIGDIIKEFKQGVLEEVGTEDFETHYELGISYKEMSLLDEAIEELKLASLEPAKFVECQGVIGLCYLEKGDYPSAMRTFQEARAKVAVRSTEYQDLTYQMAIACEEVGRMEEAAQEYQRLYQIKPDYRDVKQRLNKLLG